MNCKDYHELIVSQLCGEIEAEKELELKKHLEACEGCKQTQSEFRAILGLMHQLPERQWDEKLRIKDLLRHNQKWRSILLSKAALWIISLTLLVSVISSLPIHWEITAGGFSVDWGKDKSREEAIAHELRNLREQLSVIQKQNREWKRVSDVRMKQLLTKNNAAQEKRYWQSLEMFSNYVQLQRKADLQRIQHDIATNYDRTGQEVEKTNEMLEYVIRASATESPTYAGE